MCSSLSVNERGYYKWVNNGERPKKWQSLLAEIHRILDENLDNDNYVLASGDYNHYESGENRQN